MIKNKDAIIKAFNDFEMEAVIELIKEELNKGTEPLDLLNILTGVLRELGDKFSEGEIFLPQLFVAGEIMEQASAPIIEVITKTNKDVPVKGKIILGTVKGDVHDIGKNMVKTMLKASGFEVIDLGVDVAAQIFIETAKKVEPDIIAISSTMSTTVPMMKDVIEFLETEGIREKYKVMVGGGSITSSLAQDIRADGYGRDANEAAKVALKLVN